MLARKGAIGANNTATTVLRPLNKSTSSGELEDFVGAKFYCPHALADGSQRILIMENTMEFYSTVLSTLSPYLITANNTMINTCNIG